MAPQKPTPAKHPPCKVTIQGKRGALKVNLGQKEVRILLNILAGREVLPITDEIDDANKK